MRNAPRVLGIAALVVLLIVLLKPTATSGNTECSLGCVTTYSYDNNRDNVNPNESILKASTLSSLTAANSPDLNGVVYAQPRYVSQVTVNGNTVNAVFVATEENYVYALDGDTLAHLWNPSGNPPGINLNNTGETAVPDSALPNACINISPEVGITGTPVIDTNGNLMYVVSKHYNTTTHAVSQRLNVLNLSDGSAAAPALDIGNVIGSSFSAVNQNQRAGLALASQGIILGGPLVYVAWGSHCDSGTYTGKVAAFHLVSGALQLSAFFDDQSSGGTQGGIWMSGAAPAITITPESQNVADIYFSSGNGSFTAGSQCGESVIRVHDTSNSIAVTGFYTPNEWTILNNGSGGPPPTCPSPLHSQHLTRPVPQFAAKVISTSARAGSSWPDRSAAAICPPTQTSLS